MNDNNNNKVVKEVNKFDKQFCYLFLKFYSVLFDSQQVIDEVERKTKKRRQIIKTSSIDIGSSNESEIVRFPHTDKKSTESQ